MKKLLIRSLPLVVLAITVTTRASTTMSDVTMNITMTIADVTCQINQAQGLSQTVNMPLISLVDLQANRGKSTEAPLRVDCTASPEQPNKIFLSIQPANASSLIGDGSDGRLKTNKTGVGLLLTWKHNGSPVSLSPGQENEFLPAMASGGIWDLGIMAKPIAVPGETASGGTYTGTITLNLRYG